MKYYKLGNTYYWADDKTKIADGSVEISQEEFALGVNPPKTKSWTPLQFLELFSAEKQLAVKQAAMSNAQIGLWYDKLLASQEVVANDERLLNGLAFMIANGILTQAEVDAALSGE